MPGRNKTPLKRLTGGDVACGRNGELQERSRRRTGWTAEKRATFLEHLTATCNVRFAAGAVGLSPAAAYQLRRRNLEFRTLWADALECGYARLETMLLARAAGTDGTAGAAAMSQVGHASLTSAFLASTRPTAAPIDFDPGALLDVTDALDADAAMRLLALRAKLAAPGTRRGGGPPARASEDRLAAAIEKQLAVLARRRGDAT